MTAPLTWHLLSNRWNSAITEYALSAARSLLGCGHRAVFTPLAGSPAAERAAPHLETLPLAGYGPLDLPAAITMARRLRPRVMVAYGGPETLLATLAAKAIGAKVVRFRGHELADQSGWQRLTQRWALDRVNLVLAPSHGLADRVRGLGLRAAVATVVLGCDAARYRPVAMPDRSSRPELLVFGRLDPVKGHQVLIEHFAAMLSSWGAERHALRPRLIIVGRPANVTVADLVTVAQGRGLAVAVVEQMDGAPPVPVADVVIAPTQVTDVAALMARATLGVVPSLCSEVICRVAEEMILCGAPVAVSGVGSLGEVVANPAFGAHWGGKDPAATVRMLVERTQSAMAEGAPERQQRAEAGRLAFSFEAMGEQLDRLWYQLLRS